ncbi:hypothetical protein [Leptobacterium sp. I13]|uniref:hypothetical protein n=1 Tax=Leptobacterium meishanense TaxID=3128904 RepID=UPI0030EDE460
MKRLIQILFIAIVLAIATGYYFKNNANNATGDIIIGIAVLVTAFILMPLFIYHRSKGKKIQDYMFSQENWDKMKDKKNEKS